MDDMYAVLYESLVKPIVAKLRRELEYAPREELEGIVKEYRSKPWYTKFKRQFFFYDNFEINFEYLCARDMLNGSFSWKEADKVDEAEEKRQKEREKNIAESRRKEELVKRGKMVKRFDGGLLELERYTREGYEILSPIRVCNTRFKYLGESGADYLIDSYDSVLPYYTGIPVKKIESKPDCT